MKWILITLAIGLAASDKLDRTYLPPPGAQFSGGILGSHDAPLEPPHHTHSGQGIVIEEHEGSQPNFGINEEFVNFGDKLPKVPVTTTSYAFSQTTTYPPGSPGFKTTALQINPVTGLPINSVTGLPVNSVTGLPVNPVTGLPIKLGPENFPNGPFQGQAPIFGTNIQPGFGAQESTSAPINNGSPSYDQFINQPLNQYPGQYQGQLQFPGGQGNAEQQGLLPTGAPDSQRLDQYSGQNVVNSGGVVLTPGGNQGSVQYPEGQSVTGQQGIVPSTGSSISLQPGGNQYGVNYDGAQGQIPQGTYTGQPINVPNLGGTQPTQASYPIQEPINVGGSPSQYPNGNQKYAPSLPTGSENVYQYGSTPSSSPSAYNNGVSSTTSLPGVPSSTSSHSSVVQVYRPERPQAAADINAVILNYENVRTPNGYSYSFDTSNGIHADESGIVDNGTKAQGSYSYIGDDGKVYSVIYTADENGFQPRGDHLPTPPPIPEAIQRVIEQAERDKAAGIVHDGSYDEAKYGDKQNQETVNHRRPQNHHANQFGNGQLDGTKDDLIKPIVGIKDDEYDEGITQNQFNNNLPGTGMRKESKGNLPARRPLNKINRNHGQEVSDGNRRVSGDFDSPKGTFDGNSMPISEVFNQQSNYGTQKQESTGGRPVSNGNNLPFNEAIDSNQNNLPGSKNRGPSSRYPISGGVKDATENYPGSNVNVGATDYSETGGDRFNDYERQNSPSIISGGSGENMDTSFDSVTGAPIAGNKKQIFRQRMKGNSRPGSTGNRYTKNRNGKPQDQTFTQENTEAPSFANQQSTQHDDNGYHYQQPNKKLEQNTFPTRFSPQEVSSTGIPDQRRTEYVEGTKLRPFMTPNVYDKNDRNSQTTPNGYNQNNRNSQSTTRRPFTTVGVTYPSDSSYTDYDDGDDYASDQDIGNDRISSKRYRTENGEVTSRPNQSTQTTSRSQNVPSGGPTTQMPSHISRFGNTDIPRRMKNTQQRRPSNTDPNSTTAVGSPVTTHSPSGTRPADYEYQTTGPNSKYSGTNVGSGYPTAGSFPGSGLMLITPGVSTPQDYYTSTYGPTQGYPSTTAIPTNYGYTQSSGSQIPTGTLGSFQTLQDQPFQTGYHYGPPKSGPINLGGPGFFRPTGTSGVFPTSPTGTYQTTYQGLNGFPSTTLSPVTPGNQKTLITSQPGTAAPENSPFGTFQGNYQNGPSTPDYATTIVSTTPGDKPVFKYPRPSGTQGTTGYEYGPTGPTYSTTNSPSTIGTTPGAFIPSDTISPGQGYSTTYRPGFQTTKDTFVGGPVDGFGRPITTDQGSSHPGFGHPTQGLTGPVNNLGPIDGYDQSTTYPGGYDQTRVIGEDFSGPKQPQRYDPKTGYHY